MTLYDMVLDELRYRRCAYVDLYPPYYLCSIGCHMMNIINQQTPVYFEAGRKANLRLHILFCSPPGFSKTFWLEQFIEEPGTILHGTAIHTAFEQTMTEAGFVGTVKSSDGEPVFTYGAAYDYTDYIVGIEEFASITDMMKSQHSRSLDTALLTALDSGRVRKRLAGGSINYRTNITLWTGTQPTRFDLSSGLGRRFIFLPFLPSAQDRNIVRQARRKAKNIEWDPLRMQKIKLEFGHIFKRLKSINRINISDKVYNLFDRSKIPHFEEALYERIILGYIITHGDFDTVLELYLNQEIEDLLKREISWREQIQRGSEFAQVVMVLRDAGGQMHMQELKDELLSFGMDWSQSQQLIDALIRMKAVRKKKDFLIISEYLKDKGR